MTVFSELILYVKSTDHDSKTVGQKIRHVIRHTQT